MKECIKYHTQASVVVNAEDENEEEETAKQIQAMYRKNRRMSFGGGDRKNIKVYPLINQRKEGKETKKVIVIVIERIKKVLALFN